MIKASLLNIIQLFIFDAVIAIFLNEPTNISKNMYPAK
jgi:hypothetical protein